MKRSNRFLLGIVLSAIVVFSVFGLYMFYVRPSLISVRFIPEHVNTIPGQTGWFLVEIISGQQIDDYDVQILTNTSIDTDYVYWPQAPLLEVFLYPNSTHVDTCIQVEITFTSGFSVARDTALLYVLNWEGSELAEVIGKRDVFVDYLADSIPDFGINETVSWTPIYNCAGILVVGHYLFMSDLWELEVSWHVMIPPYDWVQVYLRHRGYVEPGWAGRIDSWSTDNTTILSTEPPEEIYRAM